MGFLDKPKGPPIIVAEIGSAHNGSKETAIELILAAHMAGADAVKLQTYTADSLTIRSSRPEFLVKNKLWEDRTLYDIYQQGQTPFEWLPELFSVARQNNINIFSSVFDLAGLEALEKVDCPAYKVASFELVDIPLIRAIAALGKPMVLSTGMATMVEVETAVAAIPKSVLLYLLQCTSSYPATPAEANLPRIKSLAYSYYDRALVGLSDHTSTDTVPIIATAFGARMIEKHIKWPGSNGLDDDFALLPTEFAGMVAAVHAAWAACQASTSVPEAEMREYRRSLWAVEDIKRGEPFRSEAIRSIRPAAGLPPRLLDMVLRQRAACDIPAGTPLQPDHLV